MILIKINTLHSKNSHRPIRISNKKLVNFYKKKTKVKAVDRLLLNAE